MDPIDPNMANIMGGKLTPDELLKTLQDCTDSAPGPDGIPYLLGAVFGTISYSFKYICPVGLGSCIMFFKTPFMNELTMKNSTYVIRNILRRHK